MNKIKIKRGLESNLSATILEEGELALTTDTQGLYTKLNDSLVKLNTANNDDLTIVQNKTSIVYDGSQAKSVRIPTIHYGTSIPDNAIGQDGDIYLVING